MHEQGVALLSIFNFCCHRKGQNYTVQKCLHVNSHSFFISFYLTLKEVCEDFFFSLLKGLLANKNRSCDFLPIEKKVFGFDYNLKVSGKSLVI